MTTMRTRQQLAAVEAGFAAMLLASGGDKWPIWPLRQHMAQQYKHPVAKLLCLLFGESALVFGVGLSVTLGLLLITELGQLFVGPPTIGFQTLAMIAGFGPLALVFWQFGFWPGKTLNWLTAPVYVADWNYIRHPGQLASPLPEKIIQVMQAILAFEPDTTFKITHFGKDPIAKAYETSESEGIPFLVWDEHADGTITIVRPPA